MRHAARIALDPQRRIALVSIGAAVVLIGVKLATGLATGSLGLLSEAAHSGTDLVAAVLTFFAVEWPCARPTADMPTVMERQGTWPRSLRRPSSSCSRCSWPTRRSSA